MIAALLEAEHAELDRRLAAGAFDDFRRMLLRHIAIEEKILLPAAREARGGEPLPVAAQLRRDHAELCRMLTEHPAPLDRIRALLALHNPLEEGPQGVYAECDQLLGPQRAAEVVRRAAQMPQVRVRQ